MGESALCRFCVLPNGSVSGWINFTDLEIGSSPDGASVYLDDLYRGLTPLTIKTVDKHVKHKICLQHERFQPYCETFDPQTKSRFSVALNKIATPCSIHRPPRPPL